MRDFFQTSSRNLRDAETKGAWDTMSFSVVGTDRLPASGDFRAKVAQENAVKAASVPYTILRATQFFEFIGRIADSAPRATRFAWRRCWFSPRRPTTWPPRSPTSHEPAAEDTVELPVRSRIRLDELAWRVLSAKGTHAR